MLSIERRDARDVAKRAYENTGQIFRYAVARGIASRNPSEDFKPRDILAEARTENRARWDQDRPRQMTLENQDWKIHRVWSTVGSEIGMQKLNGCCIECGLGGAVVSESDVAVPDQ